MDREVIGSHSRKWKCESSVECISNFGLIFLKNASLLSKKFQCYNNHDLCLWSCFRSNSSSVPKNANRTKQRCSLPKNHNSQAAVQRIIRFWPSNRIVRSFHKLSKASEKHGEPRSSVNLTMECENDYITKLIAGICTGSSYSQT